MVSKEQKVFKSLFKVLRKQYKELPLLLNKKHTVLEHLIYAAFLENTSIEKANHSFSVLERYFIDWNEIRVSTANELASVFPLLHEPIRTGERIRRTLQWIFETYFKFDLEELRGQKIEEVRQFLANIPFTTHFMINYVTHILLGIPAVPLDEGVLRVMRLLGQVQINQENHEVVPELEASDNSSFFPLIHEFGANLMNQSNSEELINLLISIDSDVSTRSWLPLVDDEEKDPAEIAKKVARRERRSKLPAILPIEDIDIEESIDSELIVEDVDQFAFDAEASWDDNHLMTSDDSTSFDESQRKKTSKDSQYNEEHLSIQISDTEIVSENEHIIKTKETKIHISKKQTFHSSKTKIDIESKSVNTEKEPSLDNSASPCSILSENSSHSEESAKIEKKRALRKKEKTIQSPSDQTSAAPTGSALKEETVSNSEKIDATTNHHSFDSKNDSDRQKTDLSSEKISQNEKTVQRKKRSTNRPVENTDWNTEQKDNNVTQQDLSEQEIEKPAPINPQNISQSNPQNVHFDTTPVFPDNAHVSTENQQTIFAPDIPVHPSSEKDNSSDETFSSDILMTDQSVDSSKDEKEKKRTYRKKKSSSQEQSKNQPPSETKKLQQEKPR